MDPRDRLQRVVSAWISDVRSASRLEKRRITSVAKQSKLPTPPLEEDGSQLEGKQIGIRRKRKRTSLNAGDRKLPKPGIPNPTMPPSPTKSTSSRTRSPAKKTAKRRHDVHENPHWNVEEEFEEEDTITMDSYSFAMTESVVATERQKRRQPSESSAAESTGSLPFAASAGGGGGSVGMFRTRSRSNSPTKSSVVGGAARSNVRMLRNNLGYAMPPMHFGPLERRSLLAGTDHYPDETMRIVRSFSEESIGKEFIPSSLDSSTLRDLAPLESFPGHLFSSQTSDALRDNILLRHILAVYDDAASAFELNRDESSWYPVIRAVLKGPDYSIADLNPLRAAAEPVIDVVEAITKNLDASLLPYLPPPLPSISSFKVDFLLEFDHRNDTNSQFYKSWYDPASKTVDVDLYYLSPILDASSVRRLLFCPVEVKPSNGDYAEASLQMGIVSQAVQRKVPVQSKRPPKEDTNRKDPQAKWLPTPGLTVVGHSWALHWTYKKPDGSSRVLGPFNCGETSSIVGIFKLVGVLQRLKRYAGEEYWPWITEHYSLVASGMKVVAS